MSSLGPWRLGLDIGVGSIGWAVLALRRSDLGKPTEHWEPQAVRDMGVTIFDSSIDEDGQSANQERRTFRSQRHRYISLKRRKESLLKTLIKSGCASAEQTDRRRARDSFIVEHELSPTPLHAPWAYRWKALRSNSPLSKHEAGIIFMSLAASRGQAFAPDSESEKILAKTRVLEEKIANAGCLAFGDWAAEQLARDPASTVRARNDVENYVARSLVIREFDLVRKRQTTLLSDEEWDKIRDLIFDPPSTGRVQPPGTCPLEPHEERLHRAHPFFQALKIAQALRNIRVVPRSDRADTQRAERLTDEEFEKAMAFLSGHRDSSASALAKAIGLSREFRLNYSDDDSDIPGNETNALLAADAAFGSTWLTISESQRQAIIEVALRYRDTRERPPFRELVKEWGLGTEQAVREVFDRLPRGRGSYGLTATKALLDALLAGEDIHDARARLYPEKKHERHWTRLPYYGRALPYDVFDGNPDGSTEEVRFGRVRNPVVHVILNQLRGLVNALVDHYGPPSEVVVELVRDIRKSELQKRRMIEAMREQRVLNDRIAQEIRDVGGRVSRDAIDRVTLLHELGIEPTCVYSGTRIHGISAALSGDFQVDHVIPRSRCGDDSRSNKVLVTVGSNKAKKDQTPYEAFGHVQGYAEILERAKRYWGNSADPRLKRKYRRFLDGAADEFTGKFTSRELTDTSYAARLARNYLACLDGIDAGGVFATRGTVTGRLRKRWKLSDLLEVPSTIQQTRNELKTRIEARRDQQRTDFSTKRANELFKLEEKYGEAKRHDLRHHALDAVVVGLVDHHRIAYYLKESEKDQREPLREPWPGFKKEIAHALDRIIVRHRPRWRRGHRITGPITKATRYRLVNRNGDRYARGRKRLEELYIGPKGSPLQKATPDKDGWLEKALEDLSGSSGAEADELRHRLLSDLAPLRFKNAYEEHRRQMLASQNSETSPKEANSLDTRARIAAWRQLCAEFARSPGGRHAISFEWKFPKNAVILKDGKTALESAGIAYADVILTRGTGGKTTYKLNAVQMTEALRTPPTSSNGGTVIARLRQGDMLAIIAGHTCRYVVVRLFKASGQIGVALHTNGNGALAAQKRGHVFDTTIEGLVACNVLFGERRARLIRPSPLGRIDS